jgi:hypothetical protein
VTNVRGHYLKITMSIPGVRIVSTYAVLHKCAKIDMHRSISVMVGKMSKIDSYQHRGSELRNTASICNEFICAFLRPLTNYMGKHQTTFSSHAYPDPIPGVFEFVFSRQRFFSTKVQSSSISTFGVSMSFKTTLLTRSQCSPDLEIQVLTVDGWNSRISAIPKMLIPRIAIFRASLTLSSSVRRSYNGVLVLSQNLVAHEWQTNFLPLPVLLS